MTRSRPLRGTKLVAACGQPDGSAARRSDPQIGNGARRARRGLAALAVVLLVLTLVAVVQTAPTTADRGEANPAMSTESKGGSSVNNDPIERHAEVVQRLGDGSLR